MIIDFNLTTLNSFTYDSYFEYVIELFNNNKTTSQEPTSELLNYTKLNISRMKRLNKYFNPNLYDIDFLNSINQNKTWLVISEGWCGDAAQNLPLINVLAKINPKIDLKIILRDENLEIMDQFLTNGSRSIPKLISIDNQSNRIDFVWGPRPKNAQLIINQLKSTNPSISIQEMAQYLHKWYTDNGGKDLISELKEIIKHNELAN